MSLNTHELHTAFYFSKKRKKLKEEKKKKKNRRKKSIHASSQNILLHHDNKSSFSLYVYGIDSGFINSYIFSEFWGAVSMEIQTFVRKKSKTDDKNIKSVHIRR